MTPPAAPDPDNRLLHHSVITAEGAAPGAWMAVLHGIYGAGRNWASVARRLVQDRPRLGALTVDLRGHGDSPPLDPPHTVRACARDVADLLHWAGLAGASILGHSFGGKVALLHGAGASPPPPTIWVIDSTPDAREPSGSAWDMLRVLRNSPGPFTDRAGAVAAVEADGFATPVARWMATNVVRDEHGDWRWRLDPDQMEDLLVSFFETDAWDVVEGPPQGTHVHFVKATESSVLSADAMARIQGAAMATGQVHLHLVEGGHWLNADNPEALHSILVDHV